MAIVQAFDSLQDENIDSLYKKALKFALLEEYKEKISVINTVALSVQEKIKAQKELLIELECAKIDDLYRENLKNDKLKRFDEKNKEIRSITSTIIKKAELQKELLIRGKITKAEILLEVEFNRLATIDNLTKEIIYTEEYYNSFLKSFLVSFVQKLQIDPLSNNFNIKNILIKLEMLNYIVELSDKILSQLKIAESIRKVDERAQKIAQILQVNSIEIESLYDRYVNIYYEALKLYQESKKENKDFAEFCQTFERSLMNDFTFFAIMPIQRISKYVFFLKEMAKWSTVQVNDTQVKNWVISCLGNMSIIGSRINAIKKLYARAKMFYEADGFKIEVKNVKYQNIKYQQIYPRGPTIFQGSGYLVENDEKNVVIDKDDKMIDDKKNTANRADAIIQDEHKREVFRVKYKQDDFGEHLHIICKEKEMQQFADDNVRYKASKVMDIFEESRKTNTTKDLKQMDNLLKSLFKYEFPDCSLIVERMEMDNEKFKMVVNDELGTKILHIEEQSGLIKYRIIVAQDPHKQFFNPVELYSLATKAASIVIKSTKESTIINDTKSLNKRTSPVCKVRPGNEDAINNAEYMKELTDTLITYGVKGIQVKHYPEELTEREICFLFEEIYILNNPNSKEDELQQIKPLLDRYQGLLLAGYIPTVDASDRGLFSRYNNNHVRIYTIETNDPLLAIKQYETLMRDNIKVTLTLNLETKEAIINHLSSEKTFRTIEIRPNGDSGGDLIKNKDHANNLSKLQTAIQLGFIPTFKDDFLEKIHTLPLRTLITIPSIYPAIALEQWKILIGSGIPAKFDTSHNNIKKQDLKNNNTIVINAINAQNAVKAYKSALDVGCNPTFSEETKAVILSVITREPAISKITIANPTIEILKRILKDGLLLDLYDALLQTLAKDVKKNKEFTTIELINITNSNNIPLLKMQIKQIERINAEIGTTKIKYKLDSQTKEVLSEQLSPKIIGELKYFYRDLSILNSIDAEDKADVFEEAVPELTVLDQLTHEKLVTFSTVYSIDNILTMYKKKKRFFDSAKISKRCMKHLEEIDRVINSRDDSPNPINKARIKPTNNPAKRMEIMVSELKTLQNIIKHENRLWFSSRLTPILNQMIYELILIQTMHNNCSLSPKNEVI